MNNKKTMLIRAPKDIIIELRSNFPNMHDADLIRAAYNASLLKLENKLRNDKRR